jgi:hypothetical protein
MRLVDGREVVVECGCGREAGENCTIRRKARFFSDLHYMPPRGPSVNQKAIHSSSLTLDFF